MGIVPEPKINLVLVGIPGWKIGSPLENTLNKSTGGLQP
jgi:hypothetical protein